jgi:polyhydroxyalkanoate synthase subunit PhaC
MNYVVHYAVDLRYVAYSMPVNAVDLRCFARGEMEVGGQHLSLQDVKSDAYVVGAVSDHIVPWQASYKATRLVGGNVRYVLAYGGHVARIVNPLGPKARHEVAGKNRPTAEWCASAESRSGSWWEGLDQATTSTAAACTGGIHAAPCLTNQPKCVV